MLFYTLKGRGIFTKRINYKDSRDFIECELWEMLHSNVPEKVFKLREVYNHG